MQSAFPLACFLSMIRPPGIQFENSLLQIAPVDKAKCPFMRNHNDIEFRLYTRHNPTVYQELIIDDDEKLFASNIDYHAPTVIFFHAFMETTDEGSAARVREAYIIRGDTNIIMVDASRLEAGPWYFTAAENTWYIGKFAAQFIDYLVSRGLDLKKTHLVGHSLGAQAAGVAGSALKSGRVSRITGLDPALPLFHGLPEEQRLDKSDADFVDVIHTDSGIFGVNQPIGHADFYPNGGISPQPGCELEVVIPQHMLLNKCENHTQPNGFYTFHLTPYKTRKSLKLERNILKLMTQIHITKNFRKGDWLKKKIEANDKDTKIYKDSDDKDTKIHKDSLQEDQIMIESVNTRKTVPYYVAIMNKETVTDTEPLNLSTNEDSDKKLDQERDTYTLPTAPLQLSTTEDMEGKLNQETDTHTQQATNKHEIKTLNQERDKNNHQAAEKSHVRKRQKRFINPFKKTEDEQQENFLFRMLGFLFKHGRNIPVYSVFREINTLVKSGQGELNHITKERNNFIGAPPPVVPVTYSLELGNESKAIAFMKRLLGLTPKGDRLTIGTGK